MRSAYLAICSGALLAASCTSTGQGRPPVVIPTPTPVPTPTPGPSPTPTPTYTSNPVVQPIERPQIIGGGGGLPVRPVRNRVVASGVTGPEITPQSSEVFGRGCGSGYTCFPPLTPTSYLVGGRISQAGLDDLFRRCRAVAGRITADCRWLIDARIDMFAELPEDVLAKGRDLFAACEIGMSEPECVDAIVNRWRIDILDNAWPRWGPGKMKEGKQTPFFFRLYASKDAAGKSAGNGAAGKAGDEADGDRAGSPVAGDSTTGEAIKYSHEMCFHLRLSGGKALIEPDAALPIVTHPQRKVQMVCSTANIGTSDLLHDVRWNVTPQSNDKLVLLVEPFYRFRDSDGYRPALLASDPIEVTIEAKKSLLQHLTDWLNEHLIPFLTALAAAIALGYAIIKRKGQVEE